MRPKSLLTSFCDLISQSYNYFKFSRFRFVRYSCNAVHLWNIVVSIHRENRNPGVCCTVDSSTPCRPRQYQRWQQPVSISRYAPDAHYASPSMQHPGLTSPRFSIFFFFFFLLRGLVLASSRLGSARFDSAPSVYIAPARGVRLGYARTWAKRVLHLQLAFRVRSLLDVAECTTLCWKIYRSPPRYFPFRPGFLPADRITRCVGWSPRLRNTLLFFFFFLCVSNPRCSSLFGKHRINDRSIERPTNNEQRDVQNENTRGRYSSRLWEESWIGDLAVWTSGRR